MVWILGTTSLGIPHIMVSHSTRYAISFRACGIACSALHHYTPLPLIPYMPLVGGMWYMVYVVCSDVLH